MGEYVAHERVAIDPLSVPLVVREHGRVDGASQCDLRLNERARQFQVIDLTHDEQVDVALGPRSSARDRAIYAGEVDAVAERQQRVAQDFGHAECLSHECFELGKNRRVAKGLEVSLPSFDLGLDEAARDQGLELSLDGALSRLGFAHDLVEVEAGIRPPEKQAQNALSRPAEQRVADCGRARP